MAVLSGGKSASAVEYHDSRRAPEYGKGTSYTIRLFLPRATDAWKYVNRVYQVFQKIQISCSLVFLLQRNRA